LIHLLLKSLLIHGQLLLNVFELRLGWLKQNVEQQQQASAGPVSGGRTLGAGDYGGLAALDQ
jgi:hypothetical protein